MQPFKDLIVLEMIEEAKEKKVGNLWVQPPKWAKPNSVGKVLDKGPEVSVVDINQTVLVNPYALLDTQEKHIKLIREKDLLCLISPTNQ
jgi:hypothetical protein